MSWMVLMALVTALACGLRSEGTALLPIASGWALVAAWLGPCAASVGSWVLVRRLKRGPAADRQFLKDAELLEGISLLLWSLGNAVWSCQASPQAMQKWLAPLPEGMLPLVQVLSLLVPVLTLLGLTWLGLFQLQWGWHAAHILRGEVHREAPKLLPYLGRLYRQNVLPLLLPAMVMLLIQGVCALVLPKGAADAIASTTQEGMSWQKIAIYGAMSAGVLGLVMVVSPWVIRWSWPSVPLGDAELQSAMRLTLAAAGCEVQEIRVWQSQRHSFNAAIVGYISPLRYLFVTERLTHGLSPGALQAVLRHEAAHVSSGHLLKRLLCMALVGILWQYGESPIWQAWNASLGISPMIAAVLLWGLTACYVVLVVGGYSRLLEYEADAAVCFDPLTKTLDRQSGEQLVEALRRIHRGTAGADWMHPPLKKRIAFLHAILEEPEQGRRFQRRLAYVPYALAALGILLLWGVLV